MGVMSCSRPECDNIMCHTYVGSIGYVCSECQNEFKEYLTVNSLNPTTDSKIRNELRKFMESDKGSFTPGNDMTIDEFFEGYDNY